MTFRSFKNPSPRRPVVVAATRDEVAALRAQLLERALPSLRTLLERVGAGEVVSRHEAADHLALVARLEAGLAQILDAARLVDATPDEVARLTTH